MKDIKTAKITTTPEIVRFTAHIIVNCIEVTCLRMMPDGYMIDMRESDKDLAAIWQKALSFRSKACNKKIVGKDAASFWNYCMELSDQTTRKTRLGVMKHQLYSDIAEALHLLYI